VSDLTFVWEGPGPLAAQLTVGVLRASSTTAAHLRPDSVTLWRSDGRGVRIRSRMHDLAERVEVGVLEFSMVGAAEEGEMSTILPTSFIGHLRVTKLVISESGTTAESGIVLKAGDGQEIIITAGAYPYTLAVKGIFSSPHAFEPEYPIEAYKRVDIA
jgi:hypothetical protein